jgi:LytS/YehU family sensor histidine kinase
MGIPPPEIQYNLLPFLGTILNNLIAALLIIGSSTAFELEFKWRSEQQLRKDAEIEQLKTNLALLRHQVSPHFFMNTLNNIHALIDINTELAKDAIVRLSTLMRYLLYDSAQGTIALKKEIEFINSFVSLMQLRYSDQVDIQVKMPEHIPDIHIPPMLFVSFLENAFKHGVSYQSKSFIHFELKMQTNNLFCSIKNSKHNAHTSQDGEYMGIGMENIKKSLQLLFRDNYSLNIADNQNSFEVDLTIPL